MADHSLQDGPLTGSAGDRLIRLRWPILAGWLAAAVLLATCVPKLDPAANELLTFLPDDSPSLRGAELLRKHFPRSAGLSQAAVVIHRPGDTLTPADRLALGAVVEAIRAPLPEDLAGNLPLSRLPVRWAGDLPHYLVPNPFLSKDRTAAIAVVEVPANFVTVRSARVVEHVRQIVRQQTWPEGLERAVTGSAAYGADYAEATNRSHDRTVWVTVAAVLVILLVVYRAPVAAFVVLGTISLAALVAHQILAIGSRYGLHVGMAERIFVYVLLYGLGVDYSLLYLSRFREYLDKGLAGPTAAGRAWSASMPAIAASSATDIVGLAMLSAASFKIFQTTGHVVPIALLVALAAAVTLVPAAAAILHRWLFWPSRRMGHVGGRRFWPAVASLVTRRPGWVLGATLIALAVPAALAVRIEYVFDA
ncbi:MAG: MMPL family transporter, partial [Planctomycetota bacterium]